MRFTKWLNKIVKKSSKIVLNPKNKKDVIVTIRAQIHPERGGIQSLIVDPPIEPVENLAEYLGFKEEKIVEWLMKDFGFKTMLFKKLFNGKKNVRYFTTVQEPFTRNRENPGDIDIIAFSKSSNAIAFECKTIKATSRPDEPVKINKAEKLEKGAIQANNYLKFGFSQVYFLIVILDDGRNYDKPNFISNHTSKEDLSKVYGGSWKNALDDNIGIIYCTIEQTRNVSVDISNNISLEIERFATQNVQAEITTERLIAF